MLTASKFKKKLKTFSQKSIQNIVFHHYMFVFYIK